MTKLIVAAAAVLLFVPVSGLMQQVDQRDQKCETIRGQVAAGRVLTAPEHANAEWNCGPVPGATP